MTAGEPEASGARQLGHRPGSRVTVAGHEIGLRECAPSGDPGGSAAQSARLSRLGQCPAQAMLSDRAGRASGRRLPLWRAGAAPRSMHAWRPDAWSVRSPGLLQRGPEQAMRWRLHAAHRASMPGLGAGRRRCRAAASCHRTDTGCRWRAARLTALGGSPNRSVPPARTVARSARQSRRAHAGRRHNEHLNGERACIAVVLNWLWC